MIRGKNVSADAMLLRMMDLCARSEQSSGEIRETLRRKGMAASDVEKILARLQADRFVDDARFARAFVNDKVRFALWGRRKIRMALASKGVGQSLASEALSGIDDDEYWTALMKAARAKSKGYDLSDFAERNKVFRSLASRGYELDLIAKAIRSLDE